MQASTYPQEVALARATGVAPKKGAFQHLDPVIKDGLIHVTGRLNNADMPNSRKRPILVPKSHPFSRVLIQHIHEELMHAGTDLVISEFRRTYWARNLRRTVQGVISRCVPCAKSRPRQLQQQMGQLPASRVNASPPFTHTGVDLCGPFKVTLGPRSRTRTTAYVCIFICFATKPVHLEVLENQSTAAFIAALLRFTSLRGRPETIYSDNGRNFVGAGKELAALRKMYNNEQQQNKIVEMAADAGIRFSFIPPRSPNFGGLWESNIKVAKRLFTSVARGARLNIVELQDIMYRISAIMNSRPLTASYVSPDALELLTPAHFLIGRPMLCVPMPTLEPEAISLPLRWKRVVHTTEQFWHRWRNEYLEQLRRYAKWTKRESNIEVGQLVLVGDDKVPAMQWPMGVVTEIFEGADGAVRVALVRTASGIYKRNVRVLAPLPIEDSVAVAPEQQEEIAGQPIATAQPSGSHPSTHSEKKPLPRAGETIWDGRLRPKGGRKWKGTKTGWVAIT